MDEDTRKKQRLFIGIPLSGEVRGFVAGIVSGIAGGTQGVRWTPDQNLHVTVKFLGECDPGAIPGIVEVMAGAAGFLPLELEIGGLGGFPSHRSARIVWVGAEDADGRITGLHRSIEGGLKKKGFEKERRAYHPHITVGRASGKPVAIPPDDLHGGGAREILSVRAVVLYRSDLSSEGARYTVIETVGAE